MRYFATKESVIINVLCHIVEFAALAASECISLFDSGKYPGHRAVEHFYDYPDNKNLNWIYRRRKKKSRCQRLTMSTVKSTIPSIAIKCLQ